MGLDNAPPIDYTKWDPFTGDESEIKCRTVKVRTARKARVCWGLSGKANHLIKPGDRYRFEKALVDGHWGEYYMCLPCMDRFIAGDY